MTIFGLFGNKCYYTTIKRKIREGYPEDKKFNATSAWAMTLSLIVAILLVALEAGIKNRFDYPAGIISFINGLIEVVAFGIFAYVMYIVEKRKANERATAKKNGSRQITEENIMRLI